LFCSSSKLTPADRYRSMALSTSVTPICQVSTLGAADYEIGTCQLALGRSVCRGCDQCLLADGGTARLGPQG
jgi:hypothetical protein